VADCGTRRNGVAFLRGGAVGIALKVRGGRPGGLDWER
jgi:hypothetical protein